MSASVWKPDSEVVNVDAESSNLSEVFTATAYQTVFTLTQFTYVLATSSLAVYRNGQRLIRGTDWTETTTSSFTLLAPVAAGETIEAVAIISSATTARDEAIAAKVAAELALDQFTDLWLGAKAVAPTVDNDGNALQTGSAYWNTASNQLFVWSGASWIAGYTGISTGTVDYIDFLVNGTPGQERRLKWNDIDGTLELGLKGGNVTLQIGQEEVIRIYNNTGSTLVDPAVVYISGSVGQKLTAALARADSLSTSDSTIAVMTESVANAASGFATVTGLVRDVNTSAFAEGAALYLSPTVAGGLTTTKPLSPNYAIRIGWCVKSHASQGIIYVSINNLSASTGGGATGAGGDQVFYENGTNVTANYSISSGKNAGSFGPITINNGVTVTVPDGSVWTIV